MRRPGGHECANNIKQILLGMHNYHSALDCFPLGTTVAFGVSNGAGQQTSGTWSALALMLPYLEQTPLYNAANFTVCNQLPPGTAINSTVFNANIAIFVCPSDGKTTTAGSWAKNNNNYYGSVGATTFPNAQMSTGIFAPARLSSPLRPPTRTITPSMRWSVESQTSSTARPTRSRLPKQSSGTRPIGRTFAMGSRGPPPLRTTRPTMHSASSHTS